MKRNLFVMHTQYNLILATGIALSRYAGEDNDLIVYPEFSITQDWKERLQRVYRRIYFVREAYADSTPGIRGIREAAEQIRQCESFLAPQYDEVIISQDRLFEGILVARLRRQNPACRCTAVEDDAYFSQIPKRTGRFFRTKKRLKSVVTRWFAGVWVDFLTPDCYGGSSYIDALYVNYPSAIRKELADKPCVEIDREAVVAGIHALYSCRKPDADQKKTVVILSDLISRYSNKETVTQVFMDVARWCGEKNLHLLIKYHPRESEKLPLQPWAEELPTTVAVEKMLLEFAPAKTLVIGNVSTSLEMAIKLGFSVVSVLHFARCDQASPVYRQWGIQIPKDRNELVSMLESFEKE